MQRIGIVFALGTAQTLGWASTYYLIALLAEPIAADLGLRVPTVFAAFSAALVVSAWVGPLAGAAIDRQGGRRVLVASSLVFALGLAALAWLQGPVGLFVAWGVLGVGMGAGLYDSAFAALVRLYGASARPAITGITLIAGFASTVGWPLTAWLMTHHGWRGTCLVWAGLHLLLGLPLNALLPRGSTLPAEGPPGATASARSDPSLPVTTPEPRLREMLALSFVFAVTWFISTAMAAHLPRLLQLAGATLASAVLVGTLVGPAQVLARLLEFGLLRRVHPLWSARLAALLHPLGAVVLLLAGPAFAPLFGLLHGAGNGILTIAKGTLPLAMFGAQGYGHRQGLLAMPARVAQAAAPWAFGLALDVWGVQALWASAVLSALALAVLLRLDVRPA